MYMRFYTCSTCKVINGVWRLHCQVCGTVPLQYRIDGVSYNIVPANGCDTVESHHQSRINLKTVELDYYAGA